MLDKINVDEYDKIHEEVNLLDNRIFKDAFRETKIMTEFLRVVLGDPKLVVEEIHTEHELTNPGNRGAILDAFCRLGDGRAINVETQHADDDDEERRVRYYGSLLTTRLTPTRAKFRDIPDVVVLFIMDYDKYHDGEVVHEIKRYEPKTGKYHDNGFREIYLTACVDDGSEIAELLQTLKTSTKLNPKFPAISEYKMNYNSRVAQKGNKKMLGPKLENLLRMSNTEAVKKARPRIIEEVRPKIIEEARTGIIEEARTGIIEEARSGIIEEARSGIIEEARSGIIEEARPGILAEGAEKNNAMIQELVRKLEEVGRSNEISRAILDLTYRRQLLTEFFPEREI